MPYGASTYSSRYYAGSLGTPAVVPVPPVPPFVAYTPIPVPYGSVAFGATAFAGYFVRQTVIALPSQLITSYLGNLSVTSVVSNLPYLPTINSGLGLLTNDHVYSLIGQQINSSLGQLTIHTSATGLRMGNIVVRGGLPEMNNDVSLRISYDRGKTFSSPQVQSLGETGQYLTNLSFRRLGIGRDIIVEVSWTSADNEILTGMYLVTNPAGT
jgi:hypothetical protein